MNATNHSQTAAFLWSIAELLRGDFKQSQYGRIILPFTLLRRLECVLEATKQKVLDSAKKHQDKPDTVREKLLLRAAKQQFYNASPLSLTQLSDAQIAEDLMSYVQSFSVDAREIFEYFRFEEFVQQLESSNLLYQVVQQFATVDLSPTTLTNFGMGIIFEELIRKFAESSNETAGEHFTPRDIVRLTTSLVMTGQDEKLKPNSIVTIYDPTAGTGGFLSEGDEYIQEISEKVTVSLHGQELNPESYAICKADMLIKGQQVSNIKLGNTLSEDQLAGSRFDFMLSNPPFGVEWKKVKAQVTKEHGTQGFDGRFGPGLPRVSDGSLLFLLHLVSKMRDPREGGSRIGIILNGSPLFTGSAGSGESEIRRYLLQNDFVEAIVALPTDMFYNTGIATYVWVLSNRKPQRRKGKVQLIDGTGQFSKMRKSLGSKRQYLNDGQIDELVRVYGRFEETPIEEKPPDKTPRSKIFPIETFGYRRITVERPLRLAFQVTPERVKAAIAEKAIAKLESEVQSRLITALTGMEAEAVYMNRSEFVKVLKAALKGQAVELKSSAMKALLKALGERNPEADICKSKGKPEADSGLRDYENVPLGASVVDYFAREVRPHVPDAWIDEGKCDELDGDIGIVGFEIPFNRHFYVFEPPRPLDEIDRELKDCTDRIKQMIEALSS
ncbi:MAG: N-6 DNA methylase [Phormidesmis sp.]